MYVPFAFAETESFHVCCFDDSKRLFSLPLWVGSSAVNGISWVTLHAKYRGGGYARKLSCSDMNCVGPEGKY